jgi:hypothetical protein
MYPLLRVYRCLSRESLGTPIPKQKDLQWRKRMVEKRYLSILLALFILITSLPWDIYIGTTRASENYLLKTQPPQDPNGNFTLDDNDQWDITGQGTLEGNITMYDQSTIIISDANITINGTIWAKGSSKIMIRSSVLRVNVPSHEPVLVEEQYDNPNGFLLMGDGTSLTIMDSTVYLNRHDIEQITEMGMMVPAEVLVNFGKLIVKDSYIDTLGSITIGTSSFNIYRGLVMHMSSELNIANSNITSGIVFYVSSCGSIDNSTLRGVSIEKNVQESNVVISNSDILRTVTVDMVSDVILENCDLKSCLIVKGCSVAFLHNTAISGLKMHENASVNMDDSEFSNEPPYPGWNHIWDNSSLTLSNSSFIRKLSFFGNSSISLYNSSMDHTELNEGAFASLRGSFIDNLSAEGNSIVWLQSSGIGKYNVNHSAKICNITTLTVGVKLNLQSLQVPVELTDLMGNIIASSDMKQQKAAEFTLIRDMISMNKTAMEMELSPMTTQAMVKADYENMHQEKNVDIVGDHIDMELKFEDYSAPILGKARLKMDPFLNTNERVHVSVHAEDIDTNLDSVALRYSVDDGATWETMMMYNTGENTFENSIPGQKDGTKVRFYIVAEDNCGNREISQYYGYTVGEGVVLINNLIVLTIIILVLITLLWTIVKIRKSKKKVSKYIHGGKK